MKQTKRLVLALLLTAAIAGGCSKGSSSETEPVAGKASNAESGLLPSDSNAGTTAENGEQMTASKNQPTADSGSAMEAENAGPVFAEVSVHDPSIIKADGIYYIYGSHLQSAKSADLVQWTSISSGVKDGNPLIPNVTTEMADALEWGQTYTFWAGDVIELADGKFYMYYSVCKGDSPRAAIGLAVSDSPVGPFSNVGILLKSGMWGEKSEDGIVYDPTIHPNTIDPHTFFDHEGLLWMVYGSYSGGIFILKMDPATGLPLPDQGYGKKLLGANHSRIEAPYILYSPEAGYYYLFLSYGGLDASGGYNIRVARSSQPDGPYVDSEDQDMIKAGGAAGSFFDDRAIEPYGVKLMGNYLLRRQPGEAGGGIGAGYVSPGHNSAFYDEEQRSYYLIFHTRFPYRGEEYEVRVHRMYINADGWPVVSPQRYSGEPDGTFAEADIPGSYKAVNHGKDISNEVKESVLLELKEDGSISGDWSGTWTLTGDGKCEITLNGTLFKGVFVKQWDAVARQETMSFTALSHNGEAVWGSAIVEREVN